VDSFLSAAFSPLSQTTNCGGVYRIGPSDISLGLASLEPCNRLLPLMWGQLPRSTEPDATFLRPLPTLASPGADQLALELSQAPENSQDEAAVRARGVRPSVL
jgi:hypothetical protein